MDPNSEPASDKPKGDPFLPWLAGFTVVAVIAVLIWNERQPPSHEPSNAPTVSSTSTEGASKPSASPSVVLDWTSSGIKESKTFQLSGDDAKVEYSCPDGRPDFYVKDANAGSSAAIAIINGSEKKGESALHVPPGKYFISSNCTGDFNVRVTDHSL